jgi:hypothetical protein
MRTDCRRLTYRSHPPGRRAGRVISLELLARVKAVLRRLDMPARKNRAPSFRAGDLEIDFAAREARLRVGSGST